MLGQNVFQNRLKELENIVMEQANEIAALKMRMASLAGKYAVTVRDTPSESSLQKQLSAYKKAFRELTGGDIISVQEPEQQPVKE